MASTVGGAAAEMALRKMNPVRCGLNSDWIVCTVYGEGR